MDVNNAGIVWAQDITYSFCTFCLTSGTITTVVYINTTSTLAILSETANHVTATSTGLATPETAKYANTTIIESTPARTGGSLSTASSQIPTFGIEGYGSALITTTEVSTSFAVKNASITVPLPPAAATSIIFYSYTFAECTTCPNYTASSEVAGFPM